VLDSDPARRAHLDVAGGQAGLAGRQAGDACVKGRAAEQAAEGVAVPSPLKISFYFESTVQSAGN